MEQKKEEGSCGTGGCGIHCGCCACKAIKGFLLLLVGGIIGFCIGHCRSGYRMCRMGGPATQFETAPAPSPVAAPKKP